MAANPGGLYGRRSTSSIELMLSLARLPCDRAGAAGMVRDLARKARRQAYAALFVATLFVATFIAVGLAIMSPVLAMAPLLFKILFLVGPLLVEAVVAWGSLSALRLAGELGSLEDAIMSGLVSEDGFCDKTVLQALYTFRARSPPAAPAGAGL